MSLRLYQNDAEPERSFYPHPNEAMGIARQVIVGIADGIGFETVLTGGLEGTHKQGSLHYVGLAEDFDFIHIEKDRPATEEEGRALRGACKLRLGPHYDVLWEAGHLHVEFQPKHGPNQR